MLCVNGINIIFMLQALVTDKNPNQGKSLNEIYNGSQRQRSDDRGEIKIQDSGENGKLMKMENLPFKKGKVRAVEKDIRRYRDPKLSGVRKEGEITTTTQ